MAESEGPGHTSATAAHILVVDDSAQIRALLVEALQQAGYRVHAAANGAEALAIVERDHVDLLLLDLMMPQMSGWTVLQYLSQCSPPVPRVIVISAAVNLRGVQGAPLVIATLRKPFDLEHLLDLVGKATSSPSAPLPPPAR